MAVARKIKTLLTVNILVFVGIILFSVYCRLQDRSEGLVQIVRSADRRVRSRQAKVGALVDREAILQRLDHLEEVVYNQLNGEPSQCPTQDKGAGQRAGGRRIVPMLWTLPCVPAAGTHVDPRGLLVTGPGMELLLLGEASIGGRQERGLLSAEGVGLGDHWLIQSHLRTPCPHKMMSTYSPRGLERTSKLEVLWHASRAGRALVQVRGHAVLSQELGGIRARLDSLPSLLEARAEVGLPFRGC